MIKFHTFCIITLSLFFSACTTIQDHSVQKTTLNEQHKHATQLTQWQLTGALAAKQHQKAWSASLTWEQFGQNSYRLTLFGPMGGNAVTIEKKQGIVTYQEGQQTQQSHHDEAFIYQKTGQKLPLSHLFYWVRGLKSPGKAIETKDEAGRLVQLKQAGYTLSYADYRVINGYDLPTKIRIEHASGWLKLIIKDWVTHA